MPFPQAVPAASFPRLQSKFAPLKALVLSFVTLLLLGIVVYAQTSSSLVLTPPSVVGGGTSSAKITLSSAAPAGGTVVTLSSSNTAAATVPATVTVAAGTTFNTFTVSTSPITTSATSTVSAVSGGVTKTAVLSVAALVPNTLSLSPTSTIGGTTSTATVTLTGNAPAGGTIVTLASSNTSAATVPATVTVAAGTSSTTFTVTAVPVGTTTSATISATVGATTASKVLTVTAPVPTTLVLNPTSVIGSSPSTGTVTITGKAPTGGLAVVLSSNNAAATVPATVTVPANATSATFTVTTTGVSTSTSATIAAAYGGTSKPATLTITSVLTSVALSPTSVRGGVVSTGTVTLSAAAPAGGRVVTLSSSDPSATVPASVTVSSGTTTKTFTVTTNPVATSTSAIITANSSGSIKTANLTITPALLSAVNVLPTSVVGSNPSNGTVTLTGNAPTGGTVVTLSSNNAAATVPTSVTVPAGSSTGTFTVTTTSVSASTSATISAVLNGTTKTATLTITPYVSGLSLSPTSVRGGASSTGTVTLAVAAPVGGQVVTLTSSNASATVPASVTVNASSTTATFTVTTSPVAASTTATITATSNGSGKTAILTVTPPVLSGVSVNPTSVLGSVSSVGTLTLTGNAPTGGTVVTLSSNNGAASVPASVTVPAGSASTTFTITTVPVAASTNVTITAVGGATKTATLTVTPPVPNTLTVNPISVIGGASVTGTITLTGNAPTGGLPVVVSSDQTFATVSTPVTVPAGSSSATFTVGTTAVAATSSATISAAYGGTTQTATLAVTPPIPSAPLNLAAIGGSARVTLNWTAPAGSVTSYKLFRRTSSGTYSNIATIAAPATSYVDGATALPIGNLINGNTYFYYLKAVNESGTGVASNTASATPVGMTERGVPVLRAIGQDSKVALSWDFIPGATKYYFSRRLDSGGPYSNFVVQNATSYVDTGLINETKYYYSMYASTDGADYDTGTAMVWVTPTAETATPAAPLGLTASATSADIWLDWDGVSNSVTYEIFRSTSSGVYPAAPFATVAGDNSYPTNGYVDQNKTRGTTYYYVVKAANAGGVGPASNEVSATVPVQPPSLSAPVNFKAVGGDTKILLTWDAYPGATQYSLWRNIAGGGFVFVTNLTNVTSYLDTGPGGTGLTNGQNYGYALNALTSSGYSSYAYANATPNQVAPLAPGVPQISALTSTSLTATLPVLPFGAASLSLQQKLSTAPVSSFADVATNQAGGAAIPLSGLTSGASYDFRCVAVNAFGTTVGTSVRVLMNGIGASNTTWAAGDPIQCAGIMYPAGGVTIPANAVGRLSAYAATDWDERYVNGVFSSVYSDTCTYTWSTNGGSFVGGVNTGQSPQWIAPSTPGTYTISMTVADQNSANKANGDSGGRNDPTHGYADDPLHFSVSVTVQ